jgi:hypothetical protein
MSDLIKGGWLCCVAGCGANAGQIVSGVLSRKIGKQKYQLIVCNVIMGLFLGGMSLSLFSASIFYFLLSYSLSSVKDNIRTNTNDSQLALAQLPITKTLLSSSSF